MHVQGINNLRYFLALVVVFSHLFFWYDVANLPVSEMYLDIVSLFNAIFRTGGETSPAVLIFITLSGYCIHRSFDGSWSEYLRRRFYRIIPLFILGIALGATVFLLFKTPLIEDFLETYEVTPQLLLFKILGAHAFFGEWFEPTYQGNAPLATVAVEIWLYAFYPIGLYILNRIGIWNFLIVMISIALLGSLTVINDPELRPWWNNGSFFGFLPYWWIGAFFLNPQFKQIIGRLNPAFIIAFFALSALILVYSQNPVFIELRKLNLAFIAGIYISWLDEVRVQKDGVFTKITKSSYSVYALHTPVIVTCIHYEVIPEIAFILVICVSYLSYLFVERPSLSYAKKRILIKAH